MKTSAAAPSQISETSFRRHSLPPAPETAAANNSDVIIVGAGLAGATASAVLGRHGLHVTLIDPRATFPAVFKAEKIEPDQVRMLRKFGLLELVLPNASRIRTIQACYNGRIFGTSQTEQYGTYYSDMVNALRSSLPPNARFRQDRVVEVRNGPDLQTVKLSSGEYLTCRLIVLACGLNSDLLAGLGLKRTLVQKYQSIALGFPIEPANGRRFSFDSVTYYSVSPKFGLDYISLFPIGREVRANLFAFPRSGDAWVREFIRDPNRGLQACFPKLQNAIGEYLVTGHVDAAVVNLYRSEYASVAGVVLIGDAGQNVCPSTGMGLNKIFADVNVLSQCVPIWFSTPGMSADKLAPFFNHPQKRSTDTKALRNAFYRRHAATDQSLKWKIHRVRLHASMQFRRRTQMEPSRS